MAKGHPRNDQGQKGTGGYFSEIKPQRENYLTFS
jgi:hypothetical protein